MKVRLKDRFAGVSRLFLLTVLAPTILAIGYFGILAADVYTSESQFVVRSPERQSSSPLLGVFLRGAGFSRAQDESYTVQNYVLSRDALAVLRDQLQLDKAFANTDVDRISRFAGLDPDNSFEALHRYYQKMVKVQTDSTSSITTLSVKAFTAQDAVNTNKLLLAQSEMLVNRLNERGRQDMIKFALTEVDQAESKAKAAALALSIFRNQEGVVDPERQATVQLQQLAKLQDELIATTTQLAQLRAFTPQNPQIPALENRAKTLQSEIVKETTKVVGGERSLANKAGVFQRLALEAEFANKQLASTLASLESARNEAQRQQVYLERVAQPSLPDVAQEPRRLRSIFATFVLGLAAWGILSMLLAGVREHQD
jgi:capsular polysaccharide transport system permease protein